MSTVDTKIHAGNALKNYLKGTGIKMGKYAESLGMTRQNLNKHLQKEELGDDFIKLVVDKLKIDIGVILSTPIVPPPILGKIVSNVYPLGPVGNDATETAKSGNEFIDIGNGRYVMLVPKVDQYAYGGYLVGFKDPEYMESLPKHAIITSSMHKGKYAAFEMRRDSMYNGEDDGIKEGDIVVARSISKDFWNSKLHIRKFSVYVIVHKEGILVKEIIEHDAEKGIITIHSKNPDKKEYPDEEISLADVNELYNVVQVTKNL